LSKLDLENLVRIGQLKVEAFSPTEFETYLRSAAERLDDAAVPGISLASKFLLAYGAAYTFSLAALRRSGYRPANRYVVFQSLAHTLDADAALWRTLARAHDVRNGFEYDGSDEVTEDLAEQVIRYANQLKSML
jgi:uncharacterized protein (UPF0332 family)